MNEERTRSAAATGGWTGVRGRGLSSVRLVAGLLLLLAAMLLPGSALVRAQAETYAVGAVVRVANTDGESLNLRAGPAPDQPIVARLAPDETVTVIATSQISGGVRWVPVQTRAGQLGWVSDQYVSPLAQTTGTTAAPPRVAASPTPDTPIAEAPVPAASPEPLMPTGQAAASSSYDPGAGGPVEVEVKVKYPEAKGRHQEITIWVTRNGQPIENATVTMLLPDDEDQELKTLNPTNAEGRTIREFTLGRNKGSVSMVISAEAPDGGKGQTEASYFVR